MTFQQIRERADRVRTISLPAVLLLSGAIRDRCDRAKWHTEKGMISCTGPKFMNWNQGVGGEAIDLAMRLNDLSFKATVEWLWDHFPNPNHREQVQPSRGTNLALPLQDTRKLPSVKGYLVHERAIPALLIQPLIEAGRLYADQRANAVFMMIVDEEQHVSSRFLSARQPECPRNLRYRTGVRPGLVGGSWPFRAHALRERLRGCQGSIPMPWKPTRPLSLCSPLLGVHTRRQPG